MIELRQDLDNGKAMFTAVSQFLMTHPVLSFGVREVTYSRLQNTEVLPTEEESESLSTGQHVNANRAGIHLFCCCDLFPSEVGAGKAAVPTLELEPGSVCDSYSACFCCCGLRSSLQILQQKCK